MTKNLAGRGEGLAGLVAKWRADAAKGKAKAAKLKLPTQDTKELTEYDTAMEHCASELETALEAAAPAGTAQPPTEARLREVLSDLEDLRDGLRQALSLAEGTRSEVSTWWLALATPSPQAPPEQCNAFSTSSGRASASGLALQALRAWEHWYSEDSTEFNRDMARELGLKVLGGAA